MRARNSPFMTNQHPNTPTHRQFDLLTLALILLLSLPALSPLFTTAPTRSADGLLHLYRLVQLDALWQQGIFYARWFPDVAYGYGLPLLNYYAPLVYYITTPLHTLGIPFSLALNLSLAAALFAGTCGMFFLTRAILQNIPAFSNSGIQNLSALIAALAFLYAPYVLFNALQRGNLAEQWALAFAPFALWRFGELVRKPNVWNWAAAIFLFTAVMLSHNVTGLMFAPLLLIFLVAAFFSIPDSNTAPRAFRSAVLFPLSAFILALALSAFFWMPALLERDYVQIARVIVTPDFDYRFNFVSPAELIAPVPRADTGRLNPSYPDTLGLVQVALSIAGILVAAIALRTRRALPIFYLAAAALGFTCLMLAISQPLWDSISLLSFVQLPMRVRGLVALCLAPLTGIFPVVLPARGRVIAAGIAGAVLVLAAAPMLYPRYAKHVPLNPTLADMFAYETQTGAFGTTSFGEYLPVWAQELPDKTPFGDAYARKEIPNRFVLPERVTVCGAKLAAQAQELCIAAPDSWHGTFRAFYFPGWRVLVNNRPVEITPTPRTGLISFQVPGSGAVRVEYAGTNAEHIAEWISLASLLIVSGILLSAFVQARRRAPKNEPAPANTLIPQPLSPAPLVLVALALIALKFVILDRVSNPFVTHFDGTRAEGITQTRAIDFDDALHWLGYDVSSSTAQRGEPVRVTLYWRTLPGLQKNLSTFVHLTAPDGFVLAQKDSLHPANVPALQWDADAYGADEHILQIPPDLAPGVYELRGGVYDPVTNTRVNTGAGADFVSLGQLTVQ